MSGESQLGVVKIRRGIFESDSLNLLLFVVAFLPVAPVLRKIKQGYSFGKEGKRKINRLLFMDDLKFYGCNANETDGLFQAAILASKDIGMNFGIEKNIALAMKRGKRLNIKGLI